MAALKGPSVAAPVESAGTQRPGRSSGLTDPLRRRVMVDPLQRAKGAQAAVQVVQRVTSIKHTAATIPFGGHRFIVGKRMEATLDPDDPVTGSATTENNYEWMRYMRSVYPRSNVIRGHLLNHDLGGYGVPENLYPISSMANSNHSDRVEQKVKANLTSSFKNSKTPIRYQVQVVEKGAPEMPYESAEFHCDWTDEGGNAFHDVIPSHLVEDSGWAGHAGKAQSPTKWRHGKRRGEENFGAVSKPLGKVAVDQTTAVAELGPKSYDDARADSTSTASTDQQMVEDALDIIEEQLNALGALLDAPQDNMIWAEGMQYCLATRALYANALATGDWSAFTVGKWEEIRNTLDQITEERAFTAYGVD